MSKGIKISRLYAISLMSLFLLAGTANADILGQQEIFFVNSQFDKYGRTQLAATLRQVGERLYFYIEDSYWSKINSSQQNPLMGNILKLADEFGNTIYPRETQLWGSEPNPGIDGDPKVTILLEELIKNNGGYFDTSHGYLRQQASNSNQREMIMINVETLLADVNFAKTFLAHEFQHLISFNQKNLLLNINEDVWLNELRSEYSVSHVGYNTPYAGSNLERRVAAFLESPSDSLIEWPNKPPDYGIAALFGEYLVEQYGTAILADTLRSSSISIDSLNQYLQSKGYEKFVDIFLNWMVAVYLNDSSRDKRFGYLRNDLKNIKVMPPYRIFLSDFLPEYSVVHAIADWQPVWVEFGLSGFSGDISKSIQLDLNVAIGERPYASYLAFFNSGAIKLGSIEFIGGKGTANVLNSSEGLNKVAVMATKGVKTSDFGSSNQAGLLSIKASVIETQKAEAGIVKDGSLIQKKGEKEIYVIWGKYKRYLTPGVIALYGHLNPANAIEIEPEFFHSYTTSNYVKYVNEEKVYAVWPPGEDSFTLGGGIASDESKHWLNITPRQWDGSGRDWGAIFTINNLELDYYRTGIDIIM